MAQNIPSNVSLSGISDKSTDIQWVNETPTHKDICATPAGDNRQAKHLPRANGSGLARQYRFRHHFHRSFCETSRLDVRCNGFITQPSNLWTSTEAAVVAHQLYRNLTEYKCSSFSRNICQF